MLETFEDRVSSLESRVSRNKAFSDMQKLERVSKKRILKYKCFASIVIASKHSTIRLRTKRDFFLRQLIDGYRFQQDNDPKHTSNRAKSYMEENNINWWITPAESPDLNPIELVWHELKHFIRNTVKPHTKDELVNGIARFWQE